MKCSNRFTYEEIEYELEINDIWKTKTLIRRGGKVVFRDEKLDLAMNRLMKHRVDFPSGKKDVFIYLRYRDLFHLDVFVSIDRKLVLGDEGEAYAIERREQSERERIARLERLPDFVNWARFGAAEGAVFSVLMLSIDISHRMQVGTAVCKGLVSFVLFGLFVGILHWRTLKRKNLGERWL